MYKQALIASATEYVNKYVWMDLDRGVVFGLVEAYELPWELYLEYPEYMLFIDKVKNNRNMKEDGKVREKNDS